MANDNDENEFIVPRAGGLEDFDPGTLQGPQPAGFSERFLAYVIDALPFLGANYLTVTFLSGSGAQLRSSGLLRIQLAWLAVYIIYEAVLSSGGRATLGKYLLNLRVVARDGGPLPFTKALARAFSYFISSATLNIGYIIALFTGENRALHDYIAGSKVVSIKERGDVADGLVLALSWALMATLGGLWLNSNVLKLSPEEKAQIITAHRTISKLGVLEEFYLRENGHYTNDLRNLATLTGNVDAVRTELLKNLEPQSLVITSNGRNFIIEAQARNWRKTRIEVKSRTAAPAQP